MKDLSDYEYVDPMTRIRTFDDRMRQLEAVLQDETTNTHKVLVTKEMKHIAGEDYANAYEENLKENNVSKEEAKEAALKKAKATSLESINNGRKVINISGAFAWSGNESSHVFISI
jgi:uncharacterized protein YtpQ (UPF0354 family)